MRVFNLTDLPLEFRGKTLPPTGGSLEFPEFDDFIPNRDQKMAQAGVVSFGQLPDAWKAQKQREAAAQAPKPSANGLKELAKPVAVPYEAPREEPYEKIEKAEKKSRR